MIKCKRNWSKRLRSLTIYLLLFLFPISVWVFCSFFLSTLIRTITPITIFWQSKPLKTTTSLHENGGEERKLSFWGQENGSTKQSRKSGFATSYVRTFHVMRNSLIVAPEFIFIVAASFYRDLLVLISKLARPIYQKGRIWGATFLAKAKPLNLTCFPVKAWERAKRTHSVILFLDDLSCAPLLEGGLIMPP